MTSRQHFDSVDQAPVGIPQDAAAHLLFALAAAALAVAVGAFGVMLVAYWASYDEVTRYWPDGIAGWLVCIPALAASLTLAVAGLRMRTP